MPLDAMDRGKGTGQVRIHFGRYGRQPAEQEPKMEGSCGGDLGSFEIHLDVICRVQDVRMKISDPTAFGCWKHDVFSTSTCDDQSYQM